MSSQLVVDFVSSSVSEDSDETSKSKSAEQNVKMKIKNKRSPGRWQSSPGLENYLALEKVIVENEVTLEYEARDTQTIMC